VNFISLKNFISLTAVQEKGPLVGAPEALEAA
jgi:hypothetical protein